MTRLQAVIGHARHKVMHVMESDIPGEPLKDAREFQVRAAVECSFERCPPFLAVPFGILEPVLYREQPNACDRGKNRDRQLHEKNMFPAQKNGEPKNIVASARFVK